MGGVKPWRCCCSSWLVWMRSTVPRTMAPLRCVLGGSAKLELHTWWHVCSRPVPLLCRTLCGLQIMAAASAGHADIVQDLLDAGAAAMPNAEGALGLVGHDAGETDPRRAAAVAGCVSYRVM